MQVGDDEECVPSGLIIVISNICSKMNISILVCFCIHISSST